MALIEIDALPILIAWWIFPWRTVSHNQRLFHGLNQPLLFDDATKLLRICGLRWAIWYDPN